MNEIRKDTKIIMWGEVTIRNGDRVFKARNHFVDLGLKGLISTMLFASGHAGSGTYPWNLWSNIWNIYLGSDTITPTTTDMTALVSPIGVAPGTAPNSKSVPTIHSGSGDGDWYAIWSATWNPGTVSGTLGEGALYMKAPDKATFGWAFSVAGYDPSVVMISRLSSADTDFSSFVIDNTKPLTVDWTIHFRFA
jgi:hypothetical protein